MLHTSLPADAPLFAFSIVRPKEIARVQRGHSLINRGLLFDSKSYDWAAAYIINRGDRFHFKIIPTFCVRLPLEKTNNESWIAQCTPGR